ncbi:MAG: hypothetical protein FJW99_08245 [Actinobacteria bacterium]|nr:hypothetical protein [Actinomycetota bacterium]
MPVRRHALALALASALTIPTAGSAAVGDITEFDVGGPRPMAIANGPDGNLWIAQYTDLGPGIGASAIGRVTPAGSYSQLTAGITPNAGTEAIAAGPDGNMWFTQRFAPVPLLARATTQGVVTDVASLPGAAGPMPITSGPDGNMWFANGTSISRSTMAGAVTDFPLGGIFVESVVAGPQNALWSVDTAGPVARTTTTGVTSTVADLTAAARPTAIAAGPDSNLWVVLRDANQIARVTTGGVTTTYANPTAFGIRVGLTAGADGALWFGTGAGRVGRISTQGTITEYVIPRAGAEAGAIASGPDGNIWFVDGPGSKVGRVLTGVTPSSTAAPVVSGTPKVGQVLTVSNGTWNHVPTGYAYSWQRCSSAAGAGCSGISGQRASTYTVTRDDVGKFLIASVTATSLNGPSQASTAAAVQVASLPKLTVTWSRTKTKRKKATVTALVTPRVGVSGYRMTALLTSGPNAYRPDANTRSGRCVAVRVEAATTKKGKQPRMVRRQRCTISLPIGAWSVMAGGWKGTELLTYTSKAFRIR